MENIIADGYLTVPLYHGTSSLFIDSIFKHGLGGRNPIQDWNILDLAKEVMALSETYLQDSESFAARKNAFKHMVEQNISGGGFNFQHGDTYLSPAKKTPIKYATSKRYGSELVTYTLDLLQELDQRNAPGVRDNLYKRFRDAFHLMDISPAPILIEVRAAPTVAVQDEEGCDPKANLELISNNIKYHPEIADDLNQQTNFRLKAPVTSESLRFWLINVTKFNGGWRAPDFTLYPLAKSE